MAADEKTEKATPKRRQEERKKGNIFQSHDVVMVLSMLVGFNALKLLAPLMYENMAHCIDSFFQYASGREIVTAENIGTMLVKGLMSFGIIALPILFVSMISAVIFTAVQTRMMFSMDAIKFKANRISFFKGVKRLFSLRSLIEVIKAIIKISVLGWLVYSEIEKRVVEIPRLMDGSVNGTIIFIGDTILSIVNMVGVFFLFIAAFDYLYQWWEYEKNLRMSKHDIKEEYKQTEGDPKIKGKIKEKQQQMANMRMMQKVPEADVIIRNPTHYAVALKYDPDKNIAPMLVAKGADRIALKIVGIAEENDIYMIENKPLARGLFESVEIDKEIPAEYYQAVAGILAFAYKLKKKKMDS